MIILGIDPGTAITGYGVLNKIGDRLETLAYGAVLTSSKTPAPERLKSIYEQLDKIIETYRPETLVIERLFFAKNERTALAVGRASGVVLLLAAQRGLQTVEYTPLEVKMAVVGYGRADKKQVQFMIQKILGLPEQPKPDDVADALALAVCHAHSVKMKSLGRVVSD
ncbi:MAG: crossover junction endodeoxyribonuclease RuvC [Armatimonadota bacterium]|nr:crossover junction endodeoxyribonuclease RuvC [Armatimonadota bacterium]